LKSVDRCGDADVSGAVVSVDVSLLISTVWLGMADDDGVDWLSESALGVAFWLFCGALFGEVCGMPAGGAGGVAEDVGFFEVRCVDPDGAVGGGGVIVDGDGVGAAGVRVPGVAAVGVGGTTGVGAVMSIGVHVEPSLE